MFEITTELFTPKESVFIDGQNYKIDTLKRTQQYQESERLMALTRDAIVEQSLRNLF